MSAQPQTVARPSILFVDDEPRVLNSMRVMFRREYELHLASSGIEALDILASSPIDVIVCDHKMPGMSGVQVLTRAKLVSPNSIRILLTGYADLDAVEGSINDGEVFRFLTKPCAPNELKQTVRLAANLALDSAGNAAARRSIPAASSALAIDDIVERAQAPTIRPASGDAPRVSPAAPSCTGTGILVFSKDDEVGEIAMAVAGGRVPIHRATSIAQVIDILTEHRPGVLFTDISQDKVTMQTMTARLKQHVPELVTIAIAEHRDVLDMVWLINHGQIFRFLRKPLSRGRCAISLKAALQHHENLLTSPELTKRHTVRTEESDAASPGILARLKFLNNLWNRR